MIETNKWSLINQRMVTATRKCQCRLFYRNKVRRFIEKLQSGSDKKVQYLCTSFPVGLSKEEVRQRGEDVMKPLVHSLS